MKPFTIEGGNTIMFAGKPVGKLTMHEGEEKQAVVKALEAATLPAPKAKSRMDVAKLDSDGNIVVNPSAAEE